MKHITGAEALELVEAATPGPWEHSGASVRVRGAPSVGALAVAAYGRPEENAALIAAAPDLARTVIALEAERDALWSALGEVLAAEEALREYDRPDNPTTPMHALAYVEARAPYVGKVREAWQALAALREAAK